MAIAEEAAMAWKETHVMDERLMFISDWLSGERTLAELCRFYGVSRKTGYKFVERYQLEGADGLKDRSVASIRAGAQRNSRPGSSGSAVKNCGRRKARSPR